MAERPYKRRRFFIDRLQLQLLAITSVYVLTTAAIFSLAMFGPLIWELNVEDPGARGATAATEFLFLHTRFWPALVVAFLTISAHSLFTSHRIVGPLYRFRVAFGHIEQGNLVPGIELRRRDFLAKEAEALNDMVTSLRERVGRLGTAHRDVVRESAGVERALQADSIREARVHLVELERALARQQQELDAFRIEAN